MKRIFATATRVFFFTMFENHSKSLILLTSNLLFVGYPEVAMGRLRVDTWVGPDNPTLPSGDFFGHNHDGAKLGGKNVGNGPTEAINPLAVAAISADLKVQEVHHH